MVRITGVEPGSLAEAHGIRAGDTLVSIDSHPVRDVLDYRFFLTEARIELEIEREKARFSVLIQKGRYDDIGLEFETFLMDRKQCCANRCIFCFIDQNPCGMRETVYFKDDDTRLSFLMGNYVTLTNVPDRELQRIVQMRLSPVNVSVHTTNPALRVKMLGNPKADRILDQLRILTDGGIDVNCQIVACRGINDGKELERTLTDLEAFFPAVQSIAVVPAGLTRHREKLYPLIPYDKKSAADLIGTVERFGDRFEKEYGFRMVYAADEFYLAAGRELPKEDAYDGYPQLDNGVGLLRSTGEEILGEIRARRDAGTWKQYKDKTAFITVCTGVAAEGFMREMTDAITKELPGVRFDVVAVKNRFFGETVTVAGLLCGQDIIDAFREKRPEILFLPAVALRHERDKFLDDLTLEEVRTAIGGKVVAIENGIPLLDAVEEVLSGEN